MLIYFCRQTGDTPNHQQVDRTQDFPSVEPRPSHPLAQGPLQDPKRYGRSKPGTEWISSSEGFWHCNDNCPLGKSTNSRASKCQSIASYQYLSIYHFDHRTSSISISFQNHAPVIFKTGCSMPYQGRLPSGLGCLKFGSHDGSFEVRPNHCLGQILPSSYWSSKKSGSVDPVLIWTAQWQVSNQPTTLVDLKQHRSTILSIQIMIKSSRANMYTQNSRQCQVCPRQMFAGIRCPKMMRVEKSMAFSPAQF